MPHDPHSGGPGSNQYGKKPKKFTGDDITVDALTELIGEESGMDDGSTSASAPATWKPVPPQLPSLGEISGQKIVAKAPIVITAEDGSAHTELFHGGVTHLGNLSTFTAADGTQQTWFYANADTIGDMDARAFADPQDAVQHAAAMKMSADTDPPPVITAPAAPLPAQTSTDKARGALEAAAAEQAPSVASVRKARWDAREKLAGALTSLEGRRDMSPAEQVAALDQAADEAFDAALTLRAAAQMAQARDFDAHQAAKLGAGGLALPSLSGDGFVNTPEDALDDVAGWAATGKADDADEWLKGLGDA